MSEFATITSMELQQIKTELHYLRECKKAMQSVIEDRDKKIAVLIRFQERELCFKPVWRQMSELTKEHKDGRWICFNHKRITESGQPPTFMKFDSIRKEWLDRAGNGFEQVSANGYFSEIYPLPKPEFKITEKDVGRKVQSQCGKIGIVLYFDKNDLSAFIGIISCAPVFTAWYYEKDNWSHTAPNREAIKITGWADE